MAAEESCGSLLQFTAYLFCQHDRQRHLHPVLGELHSVQTLVDGSLFHRRHLVHELDARLILAGARLLCGRSEEEQIGYCIVCVCVCVCIVQSTFKEPGRLTNKLLPL